MDTETGAKIIRIIFGILAFLAGWLAVRHKKEKKEKK